MNKKSKRRKFDGELDKIPEIRNWVITELKKCQVSNSEINDFKVALTEALSNIFRHAYDSEMIKPVAVTVNVEAKQIEITLRDFGKRFDVRTIPGPDLEKASEGGYGVYLMRNLLDDVQYFSMKIGTKTVLRKGRGK